MTNLASRRIVLWRVVATAMAVIAFAPSAVGDEPSALARRIDQHLTQRMLQDDIAPAPLADDAEFHRRVHLDLIGVPPTPEATRRFLAHADPRKREQLIDALLADSRHADHFATTWRALLLPEADSDPTIRYFQPGFEAWLRQRHLERVGFDAVVQELIATPIAAAGQTPQLVLQDLAAPNPLAYIASKSGDPGSIAAGVTRTFLGIRLECAQCHDHPFDAWSQEQFWNQAAFFAGIERRGRSPFSPLTEHAERRQIEMMGTDRMVPIAFLDGADPIAAANEVSTRAALARWITSAENPWFSRAVANRVWAQLMSRGIVDPVDDFGVENPPSHPELLDELAESLASSGFDLTLLYAAICRTEAYQRTSRAAAGDADSPRHFGRMAIKPMTGEQFFAVLSQAIGYQPKAGRSGAGRDEDPVRRRVLNQFASSGLYANPETSVSQALSLMNGRLVNDAASPANARSLIDDLELSTNQHVDQLYLLALSRHPTPQERQLMTTHVDAEPSQRAVRLGDVLWVLLNTAEFRWNH